MQAFVVREVGRRPLAEGLAVDVLRENSLLRFHCYDGEGDESSTYM